MKDVRILEGLLDVLDVDLTTSGLYNYEDYYAGINRFVKKFEQDNPVLVQRYVQENGLDRCCDFDGLIMDDVLEILQGQIDELKSVVKSDLDKEYRRVLDREKYVLKKD